MPEFGANHLQLGQVIFVMDTLQSRSKRTRTLVVCLQDNYSSHLGSRTNAINKELNGIYVNNEDGGEQDGGFKVIKVECHGLINHPAEQDNEGGNEKSNLLLSDLEARCIPWMNRRQLRQRDPSYSCMRQ